MNILLGNLRPGEYRKITGQEIETLYDMLRGSVSEPVQRGRKG